MKIGSEIKKVSKVFNINVHFFHFKYQRRTPNLCRENKFTNK